MPGADAASAARLDDSVPGGGRRVCAVRDRVGDTRGPASARARHTSCNTGEKERKTGYYRSSTTLFVDVTATLL